MEIAGRDLPIELTRNKRAKRLTLRLAPDGSAVRVTLPQWCRSAEAIAFAHARRNWLTEQLARIPERRDPVSEGKVQFRGADLAIDWHIERPRRPALVEGRLQIGGPRETLLRRIQKWLESEAIHFFEDDARYFCDRASVSSATVKLTRAKRRWGSCSSEGTLRLNWRLVQAPDAVRRSVVAHEVAHLIHFDHSPAFHRLLSDIYNDDLDAANRWLSRHGRELYASFG